MFRKFFIWLIKSLIIIILTTLIFSLFSFDLSSLVKELFKDIFQYASPEMQKEVVSKLSEFCSDLDDEDITSMQEEMSKRAFSLDFSKIGALCKDYNAGSIDDREFFFNVIGSSFPDKFELPKDTPLEKYNQAINLANQNKIIYVTVLLILILMLYFLAGNIESFIIILSQISFSMGVLILLPYVIIIAYIKFAGIDTTPILSTVLGGSTSFDIKAIISVVLLMLLRTYTAFILVLGAVFLAIGVIGKVYANKLSKKETEEQQEKSYKEGLDEKERKRQKSTKEMLDELEEMSKKKRA